MFSPGSFSVLSRFCGARSECFATFLKSSNNPDGSIPPLIGAFLGDVASQFFRRAACIHRLSCCPLLVPGAATSHWGSGGYRRHGIYIVFPGMSAFFVRWPLHPADFNCGDAIFVSLQFVSLGFLLRLCFAWAPVVFCIFLGA